MRLLDRSGDGFFVGDDLESLMRVDDAPAGRRLIGIGLYAAAAVMLRVSEHKHCLRRATNGSLEHLLSRESWRMRA